MKLLNNKNKTYNCLIFQTWLQNFRHMKKITFTLAFLFLSLCLSFAQQDVAFSIENFDSQEEFQKANKAFLKGKEMFHKDKIILATHYFEEAQALNPNNSELNFFLGECYLKSSQKHKALTHFEKSYQLNPTYSDKIEFKLGLGHHFLMHFDKAIEHYKKYKTLCDNTEEIKLVESKIEQCLVGLDLQKTVFPDSVINLKLLNTKYEEHSPMISADQSTIVFTSTRQPEDDKPEIPEDELHENIFISHFKDSAWSEPIPISSNLRSKYHDVNVGVSNDGQTIFVYNNTNNDGEIYATSLEGSIWLEPLLLTEPISSIYEEKWMSLSPDHRIVYFVSNRPGGYGGLDIYYVERDIEGNFLEVKNIGDAINTPEDETGVFIHPDGKTLYFSSKGHYTMGGYDIFKSTRDSNGVWSKPINLGIPVNSPDDDRFISVNAEGKVGYFSSVRPEGMGGRDIYKIIFSDMSAGKTNSQTLLLTGTIEDSKTQKPMKAVIEIVDNDSQKVITKVHSNSETGEFLVPLPKGKNYGVTAIHDDYLFYSKNFDLKNDTTYEEIELDVNLNKVAVNSSGIMRNIFFDYGKSDLKPESKIEANRLYELMKKHPKMTVEISGHTDNISSKKFNKELSWKRANAVANYIIKKGINRKRFKTVGYWFSKPIADNETKEGRKLNRRVEFKILTK